MFLRGFCDQNARKTRIVQLSGAPDPMQKAARSGKKPLRTTLWVRIRHHADGHKHLIAP